MNDAPVEIVLGLGLPIVFLVAATIITVVSVVSVNGRKRREREAIEESRRELAAYVAEGSMTPADAERLLNAGPTTGWQANFRPKA